MPKVLCLYADDSGTRNPDRQKPKDIAGDWFGLGGYLIDEEQEQIVRDLHEAFCSRWNIQVPLRSLDIRSKSKGFSWLRSLPISELRQFDSELNNLVVQAPVRGIACVIHRPGYERRYRPAHGRDIWSLCKTAFSILVERSSKLAARDGRRLRVCPERGDKTTDQRLDQYYRELKSSGMPFDKYRSSRYSPSDARFFSDVLFELEFKNKTSPMVQLADLYLYPICRSAYEKNYRLYEIIRGHGKLVDSRLDTKETDQLGIKYSCFD